MESIKSYQKMLIGVIVSINLLSTITSPINDNNFSYKEYYDEYTTGHESKVIGIPDVATTISYPFEWRIKNTADAGIATAPILSDSKKIVLNDYSKEGTSATFSYSVNEVGQYIQIPLQAYLGYRAFDESGNELPVGRGDNNRIKIALTGDGQEHTITVSYMQPRRFVLATGISLASFFAGILYLCRKQLKRKNDLEESR